MAIKLAMLGTVNSDFLKKGAYIGKSIFYSRGKKQTSVYYTFC